MAEIIATYWDYVIEETRIQRLHHRLSSKHRPQAFALEHVRLITMTDDTVQPGYTVLVRDGRVAAVGRDGDVRLPPGTRRVDGAGRYLLPGLTDMHTHNLTTTSQHLLNLANGVTTVREMDGFAWLLSTRDRIASNELLAPNMYLAGHILNAFPMGMYATVVEEPTRARELVREHAAAGYDFIKIHNRIPVEVYEAILDESRRIGIDVVGHIPHEIRVEQAIREGQRTLEHFKGYIQDWNLELTPDDYVTPTRGAEVWNCPTFYTYRTNLRGEEAKQLVEESPEMRYVSYSDRQQWLKTANEEPSEIHQNIINLSKKIFRDLMAIDARFLAGTDSGGGYPFMVSGFGLHDELEIMEDLGMSPYEVIKTATTNAADAMREEQEFGTVTVGRRADLLMVRENPLESVRNLATIDGVSVRGTWLSRVDLDEILDSLEAILNPESPEIPPRPPTPADIQDVWETLTKLSVEGYVFRDHDLKRLADAFDRMESPERARRVRAMMVESE